MPTIGALKDPIRIVCDGQTVDITDIMVEPSLGVMLGTTNKPGRSPVYAAVVYADGTLGQWKKVS